MSCKINDDVEIKVYKDEFDLGVVLPTFTDVYAVYDMGTVYVQVAGYVQVADM